MVRDFQLRRRFILGTLGILILADAGLAAYSWYAAHSQTSPKKQLEYEKSRYKFLKGDVERAQQLRDGIPAAQEDWVRFEKSLPPASAGYSSVLGEIGELARKSGLRVDTLGFKPKDVANQPFTEIQIEAAVTGNYPSVARFVNSLQRSSGLFIVDEMNLAAENQPAASHQLRVSLHMRTYFRTV